MTTNHTSVSAIASGKYDQIMANRITSAELAGNDGKLDSMFKQCGKKCPVF